MNFGCKHKCSMMHVFFHSTDCSTGYVLRGRPIHFTLIVHIWGITFKIGVFFVFAFWDWRHLKSLLLLGTIKKIELMWFFFYGQLLGQEDSEWRGLLLWRHRETTPTKGSENVPHCILITQCDVTGTCYCANTTCS